MCGDLKNNGADEWDDMRFRNVQLFSLSFSRWGGKMLNQKRLINTQNRPFQHPQWKSRLWMLSRQVAKGPLSCAMTWNNLACFYRWWSFGGEFEGGFFDVFLKNQLDDHFGFWRVKDIDLGSESVVHNPKTDKVHLKMDLRSMNWTWKPKPFVECRMLVFQGLLMLAHLDLWCKGLLSKFSRS